MDRPISPTDAPSEFYGTSSGVGRSVVSRLPGSDNTTTNRTYLLLDPSCHSVGDGTCAKVR